MAMLALLLLICWPIAELFVAIKVADAIGVALTVLLLVASWPLGIWALRSQGRAAWRRLTAAASEGRAPGAAAIDGVLVLVGGLLLIIPGFITDALGILALLPPSRAMMRSLLIRSLRSRVVVSAVRFGHPEYDVDSTAHELDRHQLRQ
jgi:UPF0716 protein FxsA